MKIGLHYIPPLWFAAARVLLGAATLFTLLAVSGRLCLPVRADLAVVFSVALLQVALFLGLTHTALRFVEAGRSAILAYTTPLWVVPPAALFLGEALNATKLLALALGLAGLAVLFNPAEFNFSNGSVVLGNGLLLMAAVAWAVCIVHVRAHQWRATPLQLMPWQMLLGGGVLAVAAAIVEEEPVRWSAPLAVVLAYNGPIASAFCFWAFITVARHLPALTTALGSLGVPVVGVLVSAIALNEPLSATKVVGLTLIATGVASLSIARSGQ